MSLLLHLLVTYANFIFSLANSPSKSNNSNLGGGSSFNIGGNKAGYNPLIKIKIRNLL
jgi:hypothetical protein